MGNRFKGIASTTEFKSANQKDAFVVTNFTVGTSETSFVVPAGTTAFTVKVKTGPAILEITHESGGDTFKIPMGRPWQENGLNATNSVTVYIKSNKPGTVVQYLRWAEPASS